MTTVLSGLVTAAYDPNDVKPGWVALVLVILLGIATFLLWRSMNHQLAKITVPTREELRQQAAGEDSDPATNSEPDGADSGPDDDKPPHR